MTTESSSVPINEPPLLPYWIQIAVTVMAIVPLVLGSYKVFWGLLMFANGMMLANLLWNRATRPR